MRGRAVVTKSVMSVAVQDPQGGPAGTWPHLQTQLSDRNTAQVRGGATRLDPRQDSTCLLPEHTG